ncbi:MAG: MFS family permease [Pseudomonadales bacterium]|jgi:MFS family permease
MSYGWRVVGGSFVSQGFVVGFFTYAVSLLTQPVQETFNVSIEMVMYGLTLGTLVGLFAMPIIGSLLDKFSVRKLFVLGVVIFAVGLWLLAQTTSIYQYIAIFGVTMALVNALAGAMISSAVVSRWFSENRGKALGVASIGTSVGGVVIPGLITFWLPDYGWRGAVENLAIVIIVFVLPFMIWSIRSWPSEVSIDDSSTAVETSSVATSAPFTAKQIISSPNFWWLGIALGLLFSSYTAILSNLTPYAAQLGLGETSASALIMIIAVSGLIGKLLFGAAADMLNQKVALWAAQCLLVIAFVLFAIEPPYVLVVAACISMGLAAGGMLPVWGSLIANIFGLHSYGLAFGLMGPIITLFVMVGFPLVGRLYDVTGSFSLGLWISAGLMFVSAIFLTPVRLSAEPVKEQ